MDNQEFNSENQETRSAKFLYSFKGYLEEQRRRLSEFESQLIVCEDYDYWWEIDFCNRVNSIINLNGEQK
jgi:hypothetical protein